MENMCRKLQNSCCTHHVIFHPQQFLFFFFGSGIDEIDNFLIYRQFVVSLDLHILHRAHIQIRL